MHVQGSPVRAVPATYTQQTKIRAIPAKYTQVTQQICLRTGDGADSGAILAASAHGHRQHGRAEQVAHGAVHPAKADVDVVEDAALEAAKGCVDHHGDQDDEVDCLHIHSCWHFDTIR